LACGRRPLERPHSAGSDISSFAASGELLDPRRARRGTIGARWCGEGVRITKQRYPLESGLVVIEAGLAQKMQSLDFSPRY
jgi:hypothetical protein